MGRLRERLVGRLMEKLRGRLRARLRARLRRRLRARLSGRLMGRLMERLRGRLMGKYEAQRVPETWSVVGTCFPTQNIRRNVYLRPGRSQVPVFSLKI